MIAGNEISSSVRTLDMCTETIITIITISQGTNYIV